MKRIVLLAVLVLAACTRSEVQRDEASELMGFELKPVQEVFADGVPFAAVSKAAPEVPTAQSSEPSGRWGSTEYAVGVWSVEKRADEALAEAWETRYSKATETAFEKGDSIGVFTHTATAVPATGAHSSNMCYITQDGTTWRAANALTGPLTGTYYATAYYPHQKTVADPTAVPHTVHTDQTRATDPSTGRTGSLEASDFMASVGTQINTTGSPAVRPTVALTFAHRMAKFTVTFTVPSRVDGGTVANVKSVRFNNFVNTCQVDLSKSGAASVKNLGTNKPDITPRLTSGTLAPGNLVTYSAIVVPQTVTKGTQIVTIVCETDAGDKELTYVVPTSGSDMAFASGNKYNLTLSATSDLAFMSELNLLDGVAKSATIDIKVANGLAWTLTSNAGWITGLTPANGTGTGAVQTVTLNVAANTGSAAREGQLTLTATATGATAVYTAVQNYTSFNAPSTGVNPTAGEQTVAVTPFTTNQMWRASVPTADAWAKLAWGTNAQTHGSGTIGSTYPASGSHEGNLGAATNLHYQFGANNTNAARTTTITYQAYDFDGVAVTATKKTVAVTQAKAVLALGANTQTVAATATSATFAVTAAAGHKGVTYTPTTGTGATSVAPNTEQTIGVATAYTSGNITVNFPFNPTNAAKTIKADVEYGAGTLTHTVTQSASAFAAAAPATVAKEGATVNITITGTNGLTYSVSKKSGDAAIVLSTNPTTGTISGGTASVPVVVAANAGAARNAVFTVTCTYSGTNHPAVDVTVDQAAFGNPINPPSSSDYVKIGSLYWAKGNLIATSSTASGNNGCKVGAPTDGGLYFQFGSLIGYKGGNQSNGGTGVGIPQAPLTTNGTYWNGSGYSWGSDAMVWPTSLVGTKTTWTNTTGSNINTLSDYYFNYSVAPWETLQQDIRTFAVSVTGQASTTGTLADGRYAPLGVGDPCTYYLGDKWRLPTGPEYAALCNNQTGVGTNYAWSACNATWTGSGGNFSGSTLYFPASGNRYSSYGSFYYVATFGYCWSSSVYNATYGLNLYFGSSWVYPQYNYNRSYGFPVRCVSSAP